MLTAMAGLLRIVAAISCAIVIIGFMTFANDEASRGSDQQVDRVGSAMNDPAPSAAAERARESKHGKPRETLDDMNDVLLTPFTGAVHSKDAWVKRLVPTVLALLTYGLGLTLLANFLPRRRATVGSDWRTAA
jgi:hypothetical protein